METVAPKALLTGATGFIGQFLVQQLLSEGYQIRTVTRDLSQSYVAQHPEFDWIEADIANPEQLKGVCEGIDFVFHLAGFAHAWGEEDPNFRRQQYLVNFEGTINLANEAVSAGVKRFIYFSSIKVCASSEDCVDETWKDTPHSLYGQVKYQAEQALLAIGHKSSMVPIILRPALVYGPGWKGNLAMMLKAIDKGYFPPPPPVAQRKSMVSVTELCQVARKAAVVAVPEHRIFIVSDGYDYSISEIYQWMRKALGKRKNHLYLPMCTWKLLAVLGNIAQKVLRKRLPINSEALHKLFGNMSYRSVYIAEELGFVPHVTLDKILPEIIEEYRRN